MARTVEVVQAELDEVRAAYRAFLLGKRPQSMKHGERELSFGSNFRETKKMLQEEIARLEMELDRLTGRRSRRRPLGV